MTINAPYGPAGIYGGREEREGKMDKQLSEALARAERAEAERDALAALDEDNDTGLAWRELYEAGKAENGRLTAALERAEADALEAWANHDRLTAALASARDVAIKLNDACDALWNDEAARRLVPIDHMTTICAAQRALRDTLPSPTSEKAEGAEEHNR